MKTESVAKAESAENWRGRDWHPGHSSWAPNGAYSWFFCFLLYEAESCFFKLVHAEFTATCDKKDFN